jgi:hypothetical protein
MAVDVGRGGQAGVSECATDGLEVETQNVNVPACRFYARMGCTLGAINCFAYADAPDEVQLRWYKPLSTP